MSKDSFHAGISTLYETASGFGRLMSRDRDAARLSIVLYHGVPDALRTRFAEQVDALARETHIVDLLAPSLELKPGLNVGITFDDALASSFRNGVDLLLERKLPCVVFVPTGCMGGHPSWLKDTDDPARHDTVLTAGQLRGYAARGVGLGSHTMTHPRLSRLTPEALRNELEHSRATLEHALDRPVQSIAFPYGDYDERVLNACRQAGYTRVFSSIPQARTEVELGFHFARVNVVPQEPLRRILLKARGAYGWLGTAVRLKRAFRGRRSAS